MQKISPEKRTKYTKREQFLVFGAPLIEEEEIEEVIKTLRSGWIGKGPKTIQFEKDFTNYAQCDHAVALSSCTAALHLALVTLGIGQGDEVIVPAMTFCATANAVIHAGATPVIVDVEKESQLISVAAIEAAITSRTKAIIPVHLGGRMCEMDDILAIAKKNNLFIVEDAAHAIEGEYKGRKTGSIGDITCFSFYATKNLTTAEGGMLTTNNKDWADKARILSLHGMNNDAWMRFSGSGYRHYDVVYPGFKYNMTDIQASLGIHQLRKIEKRYTRRKEMWEYYNEEISGLPLEIPMSLDPQSRHSLHLYTILLDNENSPISRDELLPALHEENIGTGIHYISLTLQSLYQERYGYNRGSCPNAEYISDRTLSLPLSASMTLDDAKDVVYALRFLIG
ncbi:MAG: DegT/DnrJ/EryC1/StrS family aminotransferase [Candidatus Kapaibacterium sp.]